MLPLVLSVDSGDVFPPDSRSLDGSLTIEAWLIRSKMRLVEINSHEKTVSLDNSPRWLGRLRCCRCGGVAGIQSRKRVSRAVFTRCWHDSDVRCFQFESFDATARLIEDMRKSTSRWCCDLPVVWLVIVSLGRCVRVNASDFRTRRHQGHVLLRR